MDSVDIRASTCIGPNWGGGLHLQERLPEGVFPLQGHPTPQPPWECLLPRSGGEIPAISPSEIQEHQQGLGCWLSSPSPTTDLKRL